MHWDTAIISISFLIFTLFTFYVYNQLGNAAPNIANLSYLINESKKSLSTGNMEAAIRNLTLAVESIATKEQKNYYDFGAVGDWGCSEEAAKTVKNILSREPDLVIGLGDYSYDDSMKCWSDIIKPIETLVKIVLGNHENEDNYHPYYSANKYSPPTEYMDYFGLKTQYYPIDYGNVHFLIMSTEVPFENGSPQYKFASDDLKRASENPRIKWIIVANHKTTYGPFTGPGAYYDTLDAKMFRDIYHPLFDLYRVDLVLQGHVHYYQRTFPLKYNTINPEVPTVTDRHKHYYLNPLGPMFLTVGTGGIYLGHGEDLPKPAYEASSNTEDYGVLDLKVQKYGSTLEGTFYSNDINEPVAQDTFTITKGIPRFETFVPIAEFKHIITALNNSVFINLIGKDDDPNAVLRYNIVTKPSHGRLDYFNATTGELTYSPNTGYTGTDLFTFKVTDSNNTESNPANVTITVKQLALGHKNGVK